MCAAPTRFRFCSQACQTRYGRLHYVSPRGDRDARRKARERNAVVERVDARLVFDRDGWRCWLCGATIDPDVPRRSRWGATLDHVQPLALGGLHEYANVRAAHMVCNARRGARPAP